MHGSRGEKGSHGRRCAGLGWAGPCNNQVVSKTLILIRATSHTRLRARDRYTSSTLIGGKGGAGPSSLHTTLEGPTEYVNARWM